MGDNDKVELICCGCGCGKLRPKFDAKGRERKFIKGHSEAGRFVYGFKHTEATKEKFKLRTAEKATRWSGGRYKHSKGYYFKYQPDHHFVNSDGYVLEHRLVWEEYHKAVLLPWGDCHHINDIKDDNRIENLQGMMHGLHSMISHKGKKYKRKGSPIMQ